MSRGKYSPTLDYLEHEDVEYVYNARSETPIEWDNENYNEELMFANYDSEGYDSYGYSAYDADGNYVGIGAGVDRAGRTESEYLCMTYEEFEYVLYSIRSQQ